MFEEDPRENLRICLKMAPQFCSACGDFHLSVCIRRTTDLPAGSDYDGDAFTELVVEGLKRRLATDSPRSVLIAGAADTKILKLLLDAAIAAGGETLARRLDITVLDLCETPLEMCRTFAERHGLRLTTARSDVGDYAPARSFGLVLMHGVLPFFPKDARLSYMRRIAGWLDDDGYVVSSSQIAEVSSLDEATDQSASRLAALDAFLASGDADDIAVDRDEMIERIKRAVVIRRSHPQLFADLAAMEEFYSAAGLVLPDRRVIDIVPGKSPRRYRQRTVVLGQRG